MEDLPRLALRLPFGARCEPQLMIGAEAETWRLDRGEPEGLFEQGCARHHPENRWLRRSHSGIRLGRRIQAVIAGSEGIYGGARHRCHRMQHRRASERRDHKERSDPDCQAAAQPPASLRPRPYEHASFLHAAGLPRGGHRRHGVQDGRGGQRGQAGSAARLRPRCRTAAHHPVCRAISARRRGAGARGSRRCGAWHRLCP